MIFNIYVKVVWAIKDDSIAATFVDAGAGEFLLGELNKGVEAAGDAERTGWQFNILRLLFRSLSGCFLFGPVFTIGEAAWSTSGV